MTNNRDSRPGLQVGTGPLVFGLVLAGVGSLLGAAGLAVSGAALATSVRRWIAAMDEPPAQLARRHLAKARAATAAGATAWRDGQNGASPRVLTESRG
jgi:hypothetical protein